MFQTQDDEIKNENRKVPPFSSLRVCLCLTPSPRRVPSMTQSSCFKLKLSHKHYSSNQRFATTNSFFQILLHYGVVLRRGGDFPMINACCWWSIVSIIEMRPREDWRYIVRLTVRARMRVIDRFTPPIPNYTPLHSSHTHLYPYVRYTPLIQLEFPLIFTWLFCCC